jgi:hypothetical protein
VQDNAEANLREQPKGDRSIQGSYAHYYSRVLVAHEKVYEFSNTEQCYSSGTPLGPDSHGNGADFFGEYHIQDDTLHAIFHLYKVSAVFCAKHPELDKDQLWPVAKTAEFNVDFYLMNKDSTVQLSAQNEVFFGLKSDSLRHLP